MSNLFRFYWDNGITTVWEGKYLADVIKKAGYDNEKLKEVKFFEENEKEPTRIWDTGLQKWIKKNKLNPKFEIAWKNQLSGDALLKAMDLDKFYGNCPTVEDAIQMHGFGGVLEKMIAYCQNQACFASQDTEDDDKEKFEFYKNSAQMLKSVVDLMVRMNVPDALQNDQPFSDGKL
jgi:hypothetical protein